MDNNVGTNYTVKSGDNLWNIVKNNYKAPDGGTLSNNQIQKIVNKITANNSNITNANMIFAGENIILPPVDMFETETEYEDTDSKYAQLNQWFNGNHKNAFNFNAANSSSPISNGAKELAEAQMKQFDTDENGTIDFDEFTAGYGLVDADDETKKQLENIFNFIDVNNENGIQRKELTGLYKIMDDYKGADGKITYDTFRFFANNMKADDTEREITAEDYKKLYTEYYPNDMNTYKA